MRLLVVVVVCLFVLLTNTKTRPTRSAAQSFMAFFISGLPGAIDYLLLVLVKNGKLNPNTQKRVCASLNVYLRGLCVKSSLAFFKNNNKRT